MLLNGLRYSSIIMKNNYCAYSGDGKYKAILYNYFISIRASGGKVYEG